MALITAAIPVVQTVSGCDGHDYEMDLDFSKAEMIPPERDQCNTVPLNSRLGTILGNAEYCATLLPVRTVFNRDRTTLIIRIWGNNTIGGSYFVFSSGLSVFGFQYFVSWRNQLHPKSMYYSKPLKSEKMLILTIMAAQAWSQTCSEIGSGYIPFFGETIFQATLNCTVDFGDSDVLERFFYTHSSFFRTAATWRRSSTVQNRLKGTSTLIEETQECPLPISISRPIVNILPLTVMLLALHALNLGVSIYIRKKKGNIVDAADHLVKEALGHDATTNPLEKSVGRDEFQTIKISKWLCNETGGGHFGFVGRRGDQPVESFSGIVVGNCATARAELSSAIHRAEVYKDSLEQT